MTLIPVEDGVWLYSQWLARMRHLLSLKVSPRESATRGGGGGRVDAAVDDVRIPGKSPNKLIAKQVAELLCRPHVASSLCK